MSKGRIITLSTGAKVPQIGLGTWLSKPHEVEHAVEHAVKTGYRHLDLAYIYRNQDEVGAALKKVIPSVVKREDLWITSKLWNNAHQPQEVEKQLDETLKQIGTDYLDLYLIHWPFSFVPGKGLFPKTADESEIELDLETSLVDTWKAMLALPKSKVRNVGVSNFTVDQIKGITKATGVLPAVNQVEAHPYLPQDELVAYAQETGLHLTAYSPLGNNLKGLPMLTEHDVVQSIAKKIGATPAQVLIAWGVARGFTVIPKSVQKERIESNFAQVDLSAEDVALINAIGKKQYLRFNIPYNFNPRVNVNLFGEPAEKDAKHQVKIE
ncbi:Aldo/keto reductase [Calocera viscosa TUFC12733]|uniref:Aldo/keto reductase n=1 Tax=Calocera viscosa (strain TUFC12733) TaxID=1330018 RepID=A0A167I560_CALVF|nr:Aldo/keto reductase [Calocera viscosa TUFC12733]